MNRKQAPKGTRPTSDVAVTLTLIVALLHESLIVAAPVVIVLLLVAALYDEDAS